MLYDVADVGPTPEPCSTCGFSRCAQWENAVIRQSASASAASRASRPHDHNGQSHWKFACPFHAARRGFFVCIFRYLIDTYSHPRVSKHRVSSVSFARARERLRSLATANQACNRIREHQATDDRRVTEIADDAYTRPTPAQSIVGVAGTNNTHTHKKNALELIASAAAERGNCGGAPVTHTSRPDRQKYLNIVYCENERPHQIN